MKQVEMVGVAFSTFLTTACDVVLDVLGGNDDLSGYEVRVVFVPILVEIRDVVEEMSVFTSFHKSDYDAFFDILHTNTSSSCHFWT